MSESRTCKCDQIGIKCGGNDIINLKHMFGILDQKLNASEKHFHQFLLNNTAITELEENTFHGITFDEITIIDAKKLKFINTHAFNGTNSVTKIFHINYGMNSTTPLTNSPPNYDIFKMFSSMTKLEQLWIFWTNITEIPAHAFQPIDGTQDNLTSIWFDRNHIEKIGDFSFSELNNLNSLAFFDNQFETIPTHAFDFNEVSKTKLQLYLQSNKFNGSNLQTGSLANLKRPTDLHIGWNPNWTFLDQKIFQPFLESNAENKIIFKSELNDHFDCRSYWIKKDDKYSNRTDLIKCSNGKLFTDKSNFAKCTEFK